MRIPKPAKLNTHKPYGQRVLIGFMLAVFAITTFQAIIMQTTAVRAADKPATQTLVKRYESLRALLDGKDQDGTSCWSDGAYTTSGSKELNLPAYITTGQFSSTDSPIDIYKDTKIRVPATLFDDDAPEISCPYALARAYETMFDGADLKAKRIEFIKKYFDTSAVVDTYGGKGYNIKANGAKDAYSDIRSYMLSLLSGKTESFLWWRDRILSKGFNSCWKWGDPANPATPETRFIADNWVPEESGNKAVGYMGEVAIEGRYDDGVVNCDDLKTYVMKDDNHYIMGFGDSDLQDKLDEATKEAERQAKTEGLNALFASSGTGKLQDCGIWYGLIPPGENADTGFVSDIVAWLSDSELSPFSNSYNVPITLAIPGGTGETVTIPAQNPVPEAKELAAEAVLTNFKDCLKKAYPTIEDILGITFDSPSVAASGSAEEEDTSCESSGGPLGWILCPVANLLDVVTGWLDEQVSDLLRINIAKEGEEQLKVAWVSLRNIAYIILIPMMLVTVLGTAIGVQILDAYTIKKAVPRMAMAIVFIAISWYFCLFLVNFANVLGNGVQGIITQPFGVNSKGLSGLLADAGVTGTSTGAGASGASKAGAGVIGFAAGGVAFASGLASFGIIMSSLFSVIIVLLIAFMLLVARQVILLGLIIASPLAILSWIFPGNDKLWKFWWGAFSKLLFLFPVIQAMIAMGKVFAAVVGKM